MTYCSYRPYVFPELSRQDHVDNAIFELLQSVNPKKKPIEWDIEMIGNIRDVVQQWVVERLNLCSTEEFYPFIKIKTE